MDTREIANDWEMVDETNSSARTTEHDQTEFTLEAPTTQIREEAEPMEVTGQTGQTDQPTCQCCQQVWVLIPRMVEDSVNRATPAMVGATRSACEAMCLELLEKMRVFKLEMDQRITTLQAKLEEVLMMSNSPRPSPSSSSRLLLSPKAESSEEIITLYLDFVGSLPPSILTFNNIQDEGFSLEVELRDGSGNMIKAGRESSARIKIHPLDGDLDMDDYTEEEFNQNVVQPRKDKGALLKGEYEMSLNEGRATVANFSFTDNSSKSTKNGYFRLGAQVIRGVTSGVKIKEAVSERFIVKDRRGQSQKKHGTPKLGDDIWRLNNIAEKGPIYKRLQEKGILKVKDFLQLLNTDKMALQNIANLRGKKWEETVNHAKSCELTDEYYMYPDHTNGVDLLLNCVFDIANVTFKGQGTQQNDALNVSQKELVTEMRRHAYEKRSELRICYAPGPSILQNSVQYLGATTANHGEQFLLDPNYYTPGVMPQSQPAGQHMLQSQSSSPENMNLPNNNLMGINCHTPSVLPRAEAGQSMIQSQRSYHESLKFSHINFDPVAATQGQSETLPSSSHAASGVLPQRSSDLDSEFDLDIVDTFGDLWN